MSKRGVVVGALAAGLLLLGGGSPVAANIVWCSEDPPIQVVTPGGAHLTVNNTIYFHPADRPNLKAITHDATAVSTGSGTLITVNLYFPDNFSDAYVVATSRRFGVQDSQSTNAGATGNNVVTLQLTVPIS